VAAIVKGVTDALNDHTNLPMLYGTNAGAAYDTGLTAKPGSVEAKDAAQIFALLVPTYAAFASHAHVSFLDAVKAIDTSIETFVSYMRVDGDAWGVRGPSVFEGVLQGTNSNSSYGYSGDMEDMSQNSMTHYALGDSALHPNALQSGYFMEAIMGGAATLIGVPLFGLT
jgi:hypothetical protein